MKRCTSWILGLDLDIDLNLDLAIRLLDIKSESSDHGSVLFIIT